VTAISFMLVVVVIIIGGDITSGGKITEDASLKLIYTLASVLPLTTPKIFGINKNTVIVNTKVIIIFDILFPPQFL
jgi:hypothetical protein